MRRMSSFLQTRELFQDLAGEVRLVESNDEELDWPDGHGCSLLFRARPGVADDVADVT